MSINLQDKILYLYAKLFANKKFIKFNKFLFQLSLRGMGVLNYQNNDISGEKYFIKLLAKYLKKQPRLLHA